MHSGPLGTCCAVRSAQRLMGQVTRPPDKCQAASQVGSRPTSQAWHAGSKLPVSTVELSSSTPPQKKRPCNSW